MTIPVGKQLALFIESLSRHFKTNINSVTHIIGFSLGAHVAGFAGTQLKNLSRITGIAQSISYFFCQSYYYLYIRNVIRNYQSRGPDLDSGAPPNLATYLHNFLAIEFSERVEGIFSLINKSLIKCNLNGAIS